VGKTYGQLDMRFHGWIAAQHIFFVATAHQRPGPAATSGSRPRATPIPSPSSTNGPSPT
jgi:hypothetical protein